MRKLLFICIFSLFVLGTTRSQNISNTHLAQKSVYEYYVRINAVQSRHDVISLQQLIQQQPGVIYFMANRFPVRYFLLRSEIPVTMPMLESWLNNKSFGITSFGAGIQAKENAILQYNKTKTGR